MNAHNWYRLFFALICLALLLVPANSNAKAGSMLQEETDYAAIDAYVTEQMTDLGIPGLALSIIEGGQIAHLQGFGVADSSGRTVTPQTPFYIGSLTKSFTALAVMQLAEAGKIDLDAPVQTYLPWFELADKEVSAQITVRNLLNQASGISTKDGNRFWASQQGLEGIVRGLDTIQLTQPIGTTYQYSNINFMIAGLIIEKVSGQSYADYVTEHIFKPLDMRHSYASRTSALADGLAAGHYYMFGSVFGSERAVPPAYLPAGFLIASVEDMSHYAIAQLNGGGYGESSVLSPQGTAELHVPAIPFGEGHHAMGWFVGAQDGISFLNHNGDTGHFHSFIMLTPEQDSGLVLLANASGFEQLDQVDQIARGVFLMLNGKPAAPITAPISNRFLYWAVLLTPLLQILGIVLVWRKRQRIKGWGALLVVILNLAVVFLFLGLSQLIPFPLSSMLVFFPELGYCLIAIAAIGIGWSVIYTVMYLRMRRPEQEIQTV